MRARALIAVALVATTGCDTVLHLDTVTPPPSLGDYKYRKAITVTNSGTTLEGFAVFVSLRADPDLAVHAKPDGSDITFGDTMTEYASEPIAYSADGTLQIWVSVPMLQTGPTTFFLYYGGPPRTNMVQATWPSNYLGVWHLDDTDVVTHDSAMRPHDATATTANVPSSQAGIASSARSFTATAPGEPMCATGPELELGLNSFAYSAWIYVATAPASGELPFHKGGSSAMSPGFDVEISLAAAGVSIADATANPQIAATAGSLAAGRWTLVSASVDRTNQVLQTFLDGNVGQMASVSSLGSVSNPNQPLCFGAENDGSFAFVGALDEIRLYASALPADWFHLEYETLAKPDQVLTVGSEVRVR